MQNGINVSLIKSPIQLYGTRRKGLKRSRPDVWNKEVGLKNVSSHCVGQGGRALKRSSPDVWNKEVGLKKVSSRCVGQGGRALKRSRPDVWDKEEGLRKGLVQLFETRRKGLKKVQSSCVGQVVPFGICPVLKIPSKLINKKMST